MVSVSAMTDMQIICANAACRVSETGKCVEGLALDSCPHYGNELILAEAIEEGGVDVSATTVPLSSGRALSVEAAAKLLVNWKSRVIAIIGPRETGKTTLMAGIYDLLQMGPIGDIVFARSSTLTAFEIACHDARAVSRRGTPHSERTRRGEVLFYHLDVGGGPAADGVTLLLADRSGEEYIEVADDIAGAYDLVEIQRADVITVLVDGARLLHAGRRHSIRPDITMILQGLLEAGALQTHQRVALVLTKLDLVEASEHRARAIAGFEDLHQHLSASFAGKVYGIEVFRITASPSNVDMPRGAGLRALIGFWLEEQQYVAAAVPTGQVPSRAFSRIRPLSEDSPHD
jgi:hypothetical protein